MYLLSKEPRVSSQNLEEFTTALTDPYNNIFILN